MGSFNPAASKKGTLETAATGRKNREGGGLGQRSGSDFGRLLPELPRREERRTAKKISQNFYGSPELPGEGEVLKTEHRKSTSQPTNQWRGESGERKKKLCVS